SGPVHGPERRGPQRAVPAPRRGPGPAQPLAPAGVRHVIVAAQPPVGPGHVWGAWTWDPAVVAGLALTAAVYRRGLRGRPVVRRGQAACFGAGLAVVAVALLSPLDRL